MVGCLVAALLGGCADAQREPTPVPEPVQLGEVRMAPLARTEVATGHLRPRDHSRLAFGVPGRVVDVNVIEGQTVRQGDILAALERASFLHQVKAARARAKRLNVELDHGEDELERATRLERAAAAAEHEVDAADATVRALRASRSAAKAEVAESQRLLRESVLVAPYDGVVQRVAIAEGSFVQPGIIALELATHGSLELEVQVTEAMVDELAPGQTIPLELRDREDLEATIQAIIDPYPQPGLYRVILEVPGDDLRIGQRAVARFADSPVPSLVVPLGALVRLGSDEQPSVYAVRKGIIERESVEVLAIQGDDARVEGALEAGDRVVVAGHATVAPGESVEP